MQSNEPPAPPHIRNSEEMPWLLLPEEAIPPEHPFGAHFDKKHVDGPHHFQASVKRLGHDWGSNNSKLGCSMYKLPPGKCAFPRHAHAVTDEAIYVLEGTGSLHYGQPATKHPVKKGDYVSLPCGLANPHQLFNSGEGDLIYLCMSAGLSQGIENVHYPDSNKLFAMFPGSMIGGWYPVGANVPYYSGEPGSGAAANPDAK